MTKLEFRDLVAERRRSVAGRDGASVGRRSTIAAGGSRDCPPTRRRSWPASWIASSGSRPRRRHRTRLRDLERRDRGGAGSREARSNAGHLWSLDRTAARRAGSWSCARRDRSTIGCGWWRTIARAIGSGGATAVVSGGREGAAGGDSRTSSRNAAASLLQEVGRQGHPDPERTHRSNARAAQVALVIIGRDMQDEERRSRTAGSSDGTVQPGSAGISQRARMAGSGGGS